MAQNIVVVTVHGTGSPKSDNASRGWWLPTSDFSKKLSQRLEKSRIGANIDPFTWSGYNSGSEREEAANALKRKLKSLARNGNSIYLIGHSHGGNVIEDALERFGWRQKLWHRLGWKLPSRVNGVASIGTPFLMRKRPRIRWAAVSFLLFFYLFLVLAAVGLTVVVTYFAITDPGKIKDGMPAALLALGVVLFLFSLVVRGNFQFLHPRLKPDPSRDWLSIWHPHDEAISALQAAEHLELEFYAPGAIAKRLRLILDSAIVYSLLAVLILVMSAPRRGKGAEVSMVDSIGPYMMLGLIGIILLRLMSWVLDPLVRKWANRRVRRMLRSIALGQDHYVRLSDVATKSWVFGGAELLIPDPLAARMRGCAEEALIQFIRENQKEVFLVGALSAGANLPMDLMQKLTWKELVHTIYFDYDEIVDAIAEHIVEVSSSQRGMVSA